MIMTWKHNPSAPLCACEPHAVSAAAQDRQRRIGRRAGAASGWTLPTVVLALLPKCPMCVAAYLALLGGAGVSMATLMHLRAGIVWTCWTVLLVLSVRLALRLYRQKRVRVSPALVYAYIPKDARFIRGI